MVLSVQLVTVIVALAVFILYKFRRLSNFFVDRNIPYVRPIWPLGSDWKGSLILDHFATSWDRIYQQLEPYKVGGFFFFFKPVVMVRDPDYVVKIMAADFTHFSARGFIIDEETNPLDNHLFFLNGEKWRYLRQKLSPVFSSGKLKWMFELMKDCSDKFVDNYFKDNIPLGQDVDMKEAFACFATDVISSCAFGIESNAIEESEDKLREYGKQFFALNKKIPALFLAKYMAPKVLSIFKLKSNDDKVTAFFYDVVQQTFRHRLSTGNSRNDFIQLLLELREKGEIKSEELLGKVGTDDFEISNQTGGNDVKPLKLDDKLLTAQLVLFFLAGFETVAKTLTSAMFYFSRYPECQEKARQEILSILATSGGKFTYDNVARMTYLHMCMLETLRLLPPFPVHFRECTKDYTFPDGTKIEAGTPVIVPFFSMHVDPKHFPDPFKFIPERFEGEIHHGAYTPFGSGHRVCIGKRFAEIEIKLTIAKMLVNYVVKPSAMKIDPHDWRPDSINVTNRQPLYVKFEKIQK